MAKYCCKYCSEESDNYDEFISPCCCIGSNQFVHKQCLNTWLSTNKNNEKYKKCTECKCEFKRSYTKDVNNKIQHNTSIAVSFYETIAFSLTTLMLFLIHRHDNFFNYLMLILYLITLSYISVLIDERYQGWGIIIILFILLSIPKKHGKTFCSAWVLIIFIIFSYYTLTEGFNDIYTKYSMYLSKDNKPKMYDNFINTYVDGII